MTVNNKFHYNNGNVILVASKPSRLRHKQSENKMNRIKNSSQSVLKALDEMNDAYTKKLADSIPSK